ncbi:MAG: lipoprotein insertase outer membrane protein LolB [Thioalkalispiraceae bacterium]|jgi:outer membrane lipoprotein LolB
MKYLFLLAILLLTGCASLPEPVTDKPVAVPDPQAAWQQRQANLTGLEHWHLQGRVSLRSEEESWILKVDWQQQSQKVFKILLSGPFSGMLQLSGDGSNVELNDGEQSLVAPDAESLLLEHTGIRMPVNGLRYWMLGLPQPDKKVKDLKLDVAGRLDSLQQDEWQVNIQGYQRHDGEILPVKLLINNHRLKVRFIIDQWALQPAQPVNS